MLLKLMSTLSILPLAQCCLERNLTIVGTMRLNWKGIPAEIKKIDKHNKLSTFYVHSKDDDLMLISHFQNKEECKEKWLCWHRCMIMSEWRRMKEEPQGHTFYYHSKGVVDVVDCISSNCSTKIKSKQWPLDSRTFILDTARTNANTILK